MQSLSVIVVGALCLLLSLQMFSRPVKAKYRDLRVTAAAICAFAGILCSFAGILISLFPRDHCSGIQYIGTNCATTPAIAKYAVISECAVLFFIAAMSALQFLAVRLGK